MADVIGFKITDAEVAALNEARTTLAEISSRARNAIWKQERVDMTQSLWAAGALGSLADAADNATDAIFGCLNVAASRCGLPLTDEQVYNTVVA